MERKIVVGFIICIVILSPVTGFNISSPDTVKKITENWIVPLSPEFISFINDNTHNVPSQIDKAGHRMGLIPSPIVLGESGSGILEPVYKNESKGTPSSLHETTTVILDSMEHYRMSPVNPEFIRFIEEFNSKRSQEADPDEHTLGLIPSPLDINALTLTGESESVDRDTHLVSESLSGDPRTTLITSTSSTRFDLRTCGKLTPVREQDQCGSCWAFSTYGSLESTNLPETIYDFSENNMKNTHGFDLASCKGGNYLMSVAYLTRWSGAVSEISDPYMTTSSNSPGNLPVTQHVQEIIFLPSRTGAFDNALIKQLLQKNGALYSQIRWESGYYNKNAASYYYPGSSTPNHAVVIVGWDDSYSATRFSTPPPGDGAFIVRNSWGEDWGESGYFYVSYYDTCIGKPSIQFFSEDPINYDKVYQYDPLGWVTSVSVGGGNIAWFANVFTSTQAEDLEAVSFYTPVPNSEYQIEVYRDVLSGPHGSKRDLVQTGSISNLGYHTIDLESSIPLTKGQKFSVIVKLKTPGNTYPIAVEYPLNGYSSKASAQAGQSWVSSDGNSWSDLTSDLPQSNVCLKAFTRVRETTPFNYPTATPTVIPTTPSTSTDRKSPTISILSPKFMARFSTGDDIMIEWSAKDNVAVVGVTVEYSADKGKNWITIVQNAPATGSCSWNIPATLTGSITIRVTGSDAAGNIGISTRSVSIKSGDSSSGSFTFPRVSSSGEKKSNTSTLSFENPVGGITSLAYSGYHKNQDIFIPPLSRNSVPKGAFY